MKRVTTIDRRAAKGAHLEAALARGLSVVREIRYVLAERAEGSLLVWIALDNPVREVREHVFAKELDLIGSFPEVEFEFNIVPAMGREPGQIASGAKIVYSRKEDRLAKQG